MSLKRNIVANYFGHGWVAIMSMAFIPLYIKNLGIEAFGLIGFFAVLQGIFRLIDLGMSTALNREMARFAGGATSAQAVRDLVRTIEIVSVVLAAMVFITVWMLSGFVARDWFINSTLSGSEISSAIKVMGGITALRLVEAVYTSSITGLQHQVVFNVIAAGMATLRWCGCALILVLFPPSIINFFLWQGLVSVLSLTCFRIKLLQLIFNKNCHADFSVKTLKGIKNFASSVFGVTVLGMVLSQFDKLFLSRSLELKEFGYYSLAVVVAGGLYYIFVPIQQAYMPRLNQLHAANESNNFKSAYHDASQIVAVIVGSISAVLIFFAKEILLLWTGDQQLAIQSAPLLRALCIGNMLSCLTSIPLQINLSIGNGSRVVSVYLFSVLAYMPLIVFATLNYGGLGAALAWVGINLFTVVLLLPYIEGFPIQKHLKGWIFDVLKPITCACVMALIFVELMPNSMNNILMIIYLATSLLAVMVFAAISSHTTRSLLVGGFNSIRNLLLLK